MISMNRRDALRVALVATLLPILLAGTGCGWMKARFSSDGAPAEFFIPEQETAFDQLRYADALRRGTFPSTDREKRAAQMEQVIEAYKKVEQMFPNDRVSTPRARCIIGMLYAKTPTQKDKAFQYLRAVEQEYPDDSWVLVRSLWYQGQLHDQMQDYDNAQRKYREVMERFRTSNDPEEQKFARMARERYNRVRPR
jgi:tetratricopeptide (TPR) repeat protein